MGVANIMECIKNSKSIKSVIIVTSDKCYKNFEKKIGYREDEILQGKILTVLPNLVQNSFFHLIQN